MGETFPPTVSNCGEAATTYYVQGPSSYEVPPAEGVITSWSFTTGDQPIVGFRFKVSDDEGAGPNGTRTFLTKAEEPSVNLPKNTSTTAHVRILVGGQEKIGFYLPAQGGLVQCSKAVDASAGSAPFFLGDPQPGESADFTDDHGSQYPLAAVFEDDADGDGYGDDTQDACPTNAATHGQCPSAPPANGGNTTTTSGTTTKDTTKPSIGGLSFSSTVFEAAKSGASVAKVKVGTKVTFTVSEGSSVKFTVDRKTSGRKVGKKCKVKTKGNAKKKACTRWVAVKGSFSVRAGAGKNTFTFRGRIGGKSLKPGRYRLNGKATDSAKNTSLPKNKSFTIVP